MNDYVTSVWNLRGTRLGYRLSLEKGCAHVKLMVTVAKAKCLIG